MLSRLTVGQIGSVSMMARRHFSAKQVTAAASHATSRREQRRKEELSRLKDKVLAPLSPPSNENQHIRTAISKCQNNEEVMRILHECKQCDDPSVFAKAIQTIVKINKEELRKYPVATDHILSIFAMEENSCSPDTVSYNILFNALEKLRQSSRAKVFFQQMMKRGLTPNVLTLNALLRTTRNNGDVAQAKKYWDIIVNKYEIQPDFMSYTVLLSTCGHARDVQSAEECFGQCPFPVNQTLCWKLMDVYANVADVDKMRTLRAFMEENNIELDANIYNSLILGYRLYGDWEMAIQVSQEAMSANQCNVITVDHYSAAYVRLIDGEPDWNKRVKLLEFLEYEIPNSVQKQGQHCKDFVQGARYADRIFSAYLSVYKESFGKQTFEELNRKYHIQYLDDSGRFDMLTVNLNPFDLQQATFLLPYIFQEKSDMFRATGINILIPAPNTFRFQTQTTFEDVVEILGTLKPPIVPYRKSKNLIHVSSQQMKNYVPMDEDEPLFGFDDDDE